MFLNRGIYCKFPGPSVDCVAGGAMIVLFWSLIDQPLIAYALVQCIALIGYAATVRRLWHAEKSTEPLFLWISVLLANLCALYPAWVRNDPFSWIYLGRAVPSTVGVIYLIVRIKRRMKKKGGPSALTARVMRQLANHHLRSHQK